MPSEKDRFDSHWDAIRINAEDLDPCRAGIFHPDMERLDLTREDEEEQDFDYMRKLRLKYKRKKLT